MRYKIWDRLNGGTSYILSLISYIRFGEGYKKVPSPELTSGVGYKVFHGSTLVALHSKATHWHCNGRTRMAISDHQLRSGIVSGRVTAALHQMAASLGILPVTRVFITAFYDIESSTIPPKSQSPRKKTAPKPIPSLRIRLHNHKTHNRQPVT